MARQCPTNSLLPGDRQLFCFPRSDDLRRQWLIQMDRTDLLKFTYNELHGRKFRVCDRHFHTRQFQTPARKKLCAKQIPRHINLEVIPDFPANSPINSNKPYDSCNNISVSRPPNSPPSSTFNVSLDTASSNLIEPIPCPSSEFAASKSRRCKGKYLIMYKIVIKYYCKILLMQINESKKVYILK